MGGSTKLMSSGAGGVILTTPGSIAADVTVNLPTQNCTLGIQGPAFSAKGGPGNSTSVGVNTKLTVTSVDFDTGGYFANSRFTPLVAGYYIITANSGWGIGTGVAVSSTIIYKNGVTYTSAPYAPTTNYCSSTISAVIYLNGSTDYVEVYGQQNTGTVTLYLNSFTGALVRAA